MRIILKGSIVLVVLFVAALSYRVGNGAESMIDFWIGYGAGVGAGSIAVVVASRKSKESS